MEFNVGERVFFHYTFTLDHTPTAHLQLYAGTIVGIGPERVVIKRENDGRLCSVDWREDFLLAVDGKDFSPEPPPEPKPPTHHEIIEARWYGLWWGLFWGLCLGLLVGGFCGVLFS